MNVSGASGVFVSVKERERVREREKVNVIYNLRAVENDYSECCL